MSMNVMKPTEPTTTYSDADIEESLENTEQRLTEADEEGAMLSACGEYNCVCHYEMPKYVALVRQLLAERDARLDKQQATPALNDQLKQWNIVWAIVEELKAVDFNEDEWLAGRVATALAAREAEVRRDERGALNAEFIKLVRQLAMMNRPEHLAEAIIEDVTYGAHSASRLYAAATQPDVEKKQ